MDQPGSQEKLRAPIDVNIRTMESDIKSLQESGGEMPTGASLTYASEKESGGARSPLAIGYTGPEKPMFPMTPSLSEQNAVNGTGTKLKVILIAIGVLIVLLGLGLAGYYVVFPWLFR